MDKQRVLIDLNTQHDFLAKDGTLPALNRKTVLPRIRLAMRWARRLDIAVISTIDAHRRGESNPEMPLHCIDGTPGQQKVPFTLLPNRLMIEADNTHALPSNLLTEYDQVILRKRTRDIMSNPKADRLFTEMRADYVYIMGMSVEDSVKPLALSLMARGRAVTIISDACGWWSEAEADLAFRQMHAKGATLVETGQLLAEAATLRRRSATRVSAPVEFRIPSANVSDH